MSLVTQALHNTCFDCELVVEHPQFVCVFCVCGTSITGVLVFGCCIASRHRRQRQGRPRRKVTKPAAPISGSGPRGEWQEFLRRRGVSHEGDSTARSGNPEKIVSGVRPLHHRAIGKGPMTCSKRHCSPSWSAREQLLQQFRSRNAGRNLSASARRIARHHGSIQSSDDLSSIEIS